MKLLILDVDGVMTDGTKIYGTDGEVIAKRFNDKDFTAIKRFVEDGVQVCFLSADKRVTLSICEQRKIPFHYGRNPDGVIDKPSWIPRLAEKYNVELDEMVYVGDDFYDLPMLRAVLANGGKAFVPQDANRDIKYIGATILSTKGGDGIVAEIYDRFRVAKR